MPEPVANKSIWVIGITLILSLLLLNNLKSILNYGKSIQRLKDAEIELQTLTEKQAKLKEDIEYAQTPDFLEKAALESLNLTKDASTVLVMEKTTTYTERKEHENGEILGQNTQISNINLWKKAFKLD